jgi:pimeloyl-ACP methyl ester carboxylesterase
MGGTDIPPGPLSIRDMAEDVFELLNRLNIDKAHILGVSMGSAIAQELGINHPEKVEKLIIAAGWDKTDTYMKKLFETFTGQFAADFNVYIDMMLLWCFGHEFYRQHLGDIEAVEADRKKHPFPPETFYAHCEACIGHDTRSRLKEIKAPVLLTCGEKDILIPVEFSQALSENIPGSRLEIFKNCGHLHLWEETEKYREMVLEFLA